MINVIGFKRLIFMGLLVVLNATLAFALYQYLTPEVAKTERQLRQMNGQIATIRTDIDRMQVEFDQLDHQQAFFDSLQEDRFFSTQSRRYAEDVFLRAEKASGVVSANVRVRPGQRMENEEAKKADHVILASPVSVTVQAVSDTDVYKYLYTLIKLFPGHLMVDGVTIERKSGLNDTILRAIASGRQPELVEAKLDLSWRTMVPITALDEEGGF